MRVRNSLVYQKYAQRLAGKLAHNAMLVTRKSLVGISIMNMEV